MLRRNMKQAFSDAFAAGPLLTAESQFLTAQQKSGLAYL
jgi:hypothetical protein